MVQVKYALTNIRNTHTCFMTVLVSWITVLLCLTNTISIGVCVWGSVMVGESLHLLLPPSLPFLAPPCPADHPYLACRPSQGRIMQVLLLLKLQALPAQMDR